MLKLNKQLYIIMRRIIAEHDLLPLRKDIHKINEVKSHSPLTFEYIDFLETQSVEFSFQQIAFHNPVFFNKNKKEEFLSLIKSRRFGFLEFKDNEYKNVVADYFLDTFIGKDFFELEKLFNHIDFKPEVCEFYRTFGLIALSKNEKLLYNEIIEPFNYKNKHDYSLLLHKSNIPYLMQHHEDLFSQHNLEQLYSVWLTKLEKFAKHESFNFNKKNPSVNNVLFKKAKVFTLKLAGSILCKKSPEHIEQLFNEYNDILSNRNVFDFFKEQKCVDTSYAFKLYRKNIEEYKNSHIEIEEFDLLQKNLTVDISSLTKKHLLNYDKCLTLLKNIGEFFKNEEDFKHSLMIFNDVDKKCVFSLTSTKEHYLKNGKEFLSKLLNDKDLFMNPDKYKSTFYYVHLDNKYELKHTQTKTRKI